MPRTIRSKIIAGFVGGLLFVGLLSVTFGWNILVLKNKMATMEQFHSLLDDLLEIRRYEKNIIIYGYKKKNISELSLYLHKTEDTIAELSDSIAKVAGREAFDRFKNNFKEYKALIDSSHAELDNANIYQIRKLGAAMLDFGDELLIKKHKRINEALEGMMFFSVTAVGGFIILIAILFQMEARSVIKRLKLITDATEDISKGNFRPIMDYAKKGDEISRLITHFNRMVEELDSKQEQLVQSRKLASVGTFTSGIAHEINNPLNNISLTADGLLEEFDDLTDLEAKEMILDIINQTTRASEVVKNLLDFSRNDHPVFTELTISQIMDGTLKLIKNQLMVAGIRLETDIPQDLPPIKGNLYNLEQVFINLFLNSISAMPDGGDVFIRACMEKDTHIMIEFKDTGQGISPEHLERIFDPFYTTKSVGKGTGLGLSIVYGIIKKHGGYVEVKSKVNVGTSFFVHIPAMNAENKNT
jgi:signal transduction histidine kinase